MSAPTSERAERTGTEPVTAKSARGLRLRLAVLFALVFLVLSGLLAWGSAETKPGDTQTVVAVLSAACFAFFCAALVDAVRLALHHRRDIRTSAARR